MSPFLSLFAAAVPAVLPPSPPRPAGGGESTSASAPDVVPRSLLPLLPSVLNHGPGTTGGGSNTQSGETLRRGRWSFDLRTDYTSFDGVSRDRAEEIAAGIGEFDSIDSTRVDTLSLSYGLSDDLELEASVGHYSGSGFVDAEFDGLAAESSTADPEGLTDTWILAKYRVLHGPAGHLALLGGIKLPTGKDDVRLSNGERLEPSSQPGSGSLDYQAGLAYSRFLSPRLALDASAAYVLRTEHEGFEVGDRADLGVALNYRLTEDVRAPWNWSVFGELSFIWLDKDQAGGEINENSGGQTLYLFTGVRSRINEHVALSLAPGLPIYLDQNGEQVEPDWRAAVTLSLTP